MFKTQLNVRAVPMLGVVSLALLLLIFRSFLSYLRPVRVGDRFARPLVATICSYTVTKQNRAFSAAGPSIWNGLSLELRSLPRYLSSLFYSLLKTFIFHGPGLGVLMSSYLEGALYKFHR